MVGGQSPSKTEKKGDVFLEYKKYPVLRKKTVIPTKKCPYLNSVQIFL